MQAKWIKIDLGLCFVLSIRGKGAFTLLETEQALHLYLPQFQSYLVLLMLGLRNYLIHV